LTWKLWIAPVNIQAFSIIDNLNKMRKRVYLLRREFDAVFVKGIVVSNLNLHGEKFVNASG
jgi:hypothetical protein